mmetsp:Transcript_1978/g.5467  ORF Transcript_1978/g.5467 Transcript_1978/m.5467 type:complete len:238 (-) Transcript_1978:213-926(-)
MLPRVPFCSLDSLVGRLVGVLGRLGGLVHHGVGILNTNTISTSLGTEDCHQVIIVLTVGPVTLPFQEGGDGGEAGGTSLDHAAQRSFVGNRTGGTAAVFHNINVVAFTQHLNGGPGDTHLSPETSHDDVLLSSGLDGSTEAFIIPRVHAGAFHNGVIIKHIQQLWPDVAREALCLHGSEDGGNIEQLGNLGQQDSVVDEGVLVNVVNSKGHLGLVVDEQHNGIFRSEELLVVVSRHD